MWKYETLDEYFILVGIPRSLATTILFSCSCLVVCEGIYTNCSVGPLIAVAAERERGKGKTSTAHVCEQYKGPCTNDVSTKGGRGG